jgi:hypothetical protein
MRYKETFLRRVTVVVICLACSFLSSLLFAQTPQSGSTTAVLLIDTDDACRLSVDDEDKGIVTPAHSQKFTVGLGQHILKCTIESIPDLVWRKVVDVKDASQVAAAISLKALHIQYEQVLTKAQNQKAEAEAEVAKKIAEAKAEETLRKEELADAFQAVSGDWRRFGRGNFHEQLTFERLDGNTVFGTVTDNFFLEEFQFTIVGATQLRFKEYKCVKASKSAKYLLPPDAKKLGDGWWDCSGYHSAAYDDSTITVNGKTLTWTLPRGAFPSMSFTR